MSKYATKVVRVAGITALTTAFAMFSTGALAATNGTSVVNSGDRVNIESEVEKESTVIVNNNNTAATTQTVLSNANTGGNSANRNIGGTSVTTGNAVTSSALGVEANHNTTAISMPSTGADANLTDVVNTGNRADVETEVEIENTVVVNNTNSLYSMQGATSNSNTGANRASRNIGPTAVTTGNAGVSTDMWVDGNRNETAIGSMSGNGGSLLNSTMVTNTGNRADVESEAESETTVIVNNTNMGWFSQYMMGNSYTGLNLASRNIGATGVATGNALVSANMGVEANHNTTGIGGSALAPTGINLFDVVNTGNYFEGEAESETELVTVVNNGNLLTSLQSLFLNSNTGYSSARRNIGSSLISTGVGATGSSVYSGGNHNMTLIGSLIALAGLFEI